MGERLVRSVRVVEAPSAGSTVTGRRGRRPSAPWLLGTIRAGFRQLAQLRRGPALHPYGLTCAAELEVVDDGGGLWGVPWLDEPGRYETTVRLSRAAGLPGRLPDGLGLALRVEGAAGPGRPFDLLLTSSGRGRVGRHLPQPRTDVLSGPYSSLLPYRVGGHSSLLAAFPRRTRREPVRGDLTSLREVLTAGTLVFDLCAETSGRAWRAFAVLTVGAPLPVPPTESLDSDIYTHSGRGFRPGSALAAIRRAAYRGSQADRREKGRPGRIPDGR
ncbi:phosphodiesterase [Streptomyces sp. NPDC087844]|uniref:phosphodiesterase n=1 Tax=Streptomyces sp. NPDC087844 TaxID=3365805 RepID=UPI003804F49A